MSARMLMRHSMYATDGRARTSCRLKLSTGVRQLLTSLAESTIVWRHGGDILATPPPLALLARG